LANLYSWADRLLNVVAWLMVIRLADGSLGLVIGALVLARILTIALPRMSLYLDRIVWVVILVGPAVNREWTPALIGVALWAAWIVVAGLGRSAMR